MEDYAAIEALLSRLALGEAVAASSWPETDLSPALLGLTIEGDQLVWPHLPDELNEIEIRRALDDLDISVFKLVGSTNTVMLETPGSVDRKIYLAEFQAGGRGRRGRSWISPYARNLAMTVGMRSRYELNQLGGLSVVAGLAIASHIETLGVEGVAVKWPNDVLIDDEKVCGILVELVQKDGGVEVVVGTGINVLLNDVEREAIGQPVTDLRHHGVVLDRTELAIGFLESIWHHLKHFEAQGFEPFRQSFDAVHKFHGQRCTVIQGEHRISGTVVGIGPEGELKMSTREGERSFHGGEVSLRME